SRRWSRRRCACAASRWGRPRGWTCTATRASSSPSSASTSVTASPAGAAAPPWPWIASAAGRPRTIALNVRAEGPLRCTRRRRRAARGGPGPGRLRRGRGGPPPPPPPPPRRPRRPPPPPPPAPSAGPPGPPTTTVRKAGVVRLGDASAYVALATTDVTVRSRPGGGDVVAVFPQELPWGGPTPFLISEARRTAAGE